MLGFTTLQSSFFRAHIGNAHGFHMDIPGSNRGYDGGFAPLFSSTESDKQEEIF